MLTLWSKFIWEKHQYAMISTFEVAIRKLIIADCEIDADINRASLTYS